jgi:uncharacterized membrane protein
MTDLVQSSDGVRTAQARSPGLTRGTTELSATAVTLMAFGGVMWTLAVGALAVWRHNEFLSHRYDLGNMVQAIWSTTQGRLLETTDGTSGEQITRLASHIDPALALFAPLWWIHASPETLLVAQAAALASGIYPAVRLALKYTRSLLAGGLVGAWYLSFPWMVWNAVNDVHPVTLAIPLILYAIWFLDEQRLLLFAVFGGLAMLTGELVGLTVAALGVWYALTHRRYRAGVSIALAGTAWTAVCLGLLIPAFNDGGESRYYNRFESVGGSPLGVIKTLFTDPSAILAAVSTGADLEYALLLLSPTAFLALGQPALLIAVLPQLGVNTLSGFWSTTQPMYQYAAPMIAPLVAATIIAVGRFPARFRSPVAAAVLVASLACLAATPPAPGGEPYVFGQRETSARTAAMGEAIALVPPNAPVTATNRLGAHLSSRRTIYLFPHREHAAWAVLDTRDPWLVAAGEQTDERLFSTLLTRFARDPTWRLIFDDEDVRVYRRVT